MKLLLRRSFHASYVVTVINGEFFLPSALDESENFVFRRFIITFLHEGLEYCGAHVVVESFTVEVWSHVLSLVTSSNSFLTCWWLAFHPNIIMNAFSLLSMASPSRFNSGVWKAPPNCVWWKWCWCQVGLGMKYKCTLNIIIIANFIAIQNPSTYCIWGFVSTFGLPFWRVNVEFTSSWSKGFLNLKLCNPLFDWLHECHVLNI